MYRVFLSSLILCLVTAAGCRLRPNEPAASPSQTPISTATPTNSPTPESTPAGSVGMSETLRCHKVDAGDYKVYQKQTFAIDFEPFRGSCFVTSHNPEYEDPPMESQFAIYKGGKKVFDFPSQFNGVNFGCWVDAVAFQDLNDDKLTDVIVVSKCQAKSDSYNENTVYANTGKAFITREDANMQLGEMQTIKQVVDFVNENRKTYF